MSPLRKKSSFTLKPVVRSDLPAMAEVCGLAFANDRHTMLKAAHPTRPYDHAAGMRGTFEYWISCPSGSLELTKAVDDTTGEVLGFVCWGMNLDKAPWSGQGEKGVGSCTKRPDVTPTGETFPNQDPTLDPLERLEEMTSAHLAAFQERFRDTRCMYVITIAVHPEHQGRGVGPALIKRGTSRADAEGALCWVQSSEAGGLHACQKCGFEEDDRLEVDLDRWAQKLNIKPPAGDDKWGTYAFRYLVRRPKIASTKPLRC